MINIDFEVAVVSVANLACELQPGVSWDAPAGSRQEIENGLVSVGNEC